MSGRLRRRDKSKPLKLLLQTDLQINGCDKRLVNLFFSMNNIFNAYK